jgi:thiol-disulfide isomerase/thioredoxin
MMTTALLLAFIAAPAAERSAEPLLLDFHASWCGPCQQMRPAVEQLIRKGYRVKSIDIDRSPEVAERYQVSEVPTFIVVDADGRAVSRTKGAQPASQLARLYLAAKAKAGPPPAEAPAAARDEPADADDDDEPVEAERHDDDDRPAPPAVNPKPWETVVRIKVHNQGTTGFGSGTIIHSTPKESLILTCAHIFKLDGPRQAPPAKFPLRLTIDLFDGNLVGQTVHYANETFEGEAIDYDFARDVGLIRIRPGRRLPSARVIPAHWKPQAKMAMITVGCSEGHDATAWSTMIRNPGLRGILSGNSTYEAIECTSAPKQGRSGGGLFTTDGYVAGVCDFAEPRGNHGLYASPRSIHHLLDRNNLTALYAPADRQGGTLLAGAGKDAARRGAPAKPAAIARAQSPDRDEPNKVVTIPPPEMLGIKPVAAPADAGRARVASGREPWRPVPQPASQQVAREADDDRFSALPPDPAPADEPAPEAPKSRPSGVRWRPVRSATAEPSAN